MEGELVHVQVAIYDGQDKDDKSEYIQTLVG